MGQSTRNALHTHESSTRLHDMMRVHLFDSIARTNDETNPCKHGCQHTHKDTGKHTDRPENGFPSLRSICDRRGCAQMHDLRQRAKAVPFVRYETQKLLSKMLNASQILRTRRLSKELVRFRGCCCLVDFEAAVFVMNGIPPRVAGPIQLQGIQKYVSGKPS